MSHPERIPDPIAELLHKGAFLDATQTKAARAAFMERVDAELERSRGGPRAVWFAPVAVAAAVLLAWVLWPAETLSYEVAGAARDGNYVRAAESPAVVRFSDATEVTALPGTRLRVVETRGDGAQISVESGSLAVRVTHTGSSAWNFAAGPFDVHVTGTRFDLSWDAVLERLTVELHEGSVEIAGYDESGPVHVRAGQRFVGDARKRTMQVSDVNGAAAAAELRRENVVEPTLAPAADAQDSGPGPDEDRAPTVQKSSSKKKASSARGSADPIPWTTLVSKGKFSEVVAAANARGVDGCLAVCTADDLGALADAARYTGQSSLASRSLNAMRGRFSGTAKVRAAFLLGRLHEGQGQLGVAQKWYETSLREAPSGGFAGESLAGKMRVILKLQGRAAARPIAQEYLRRYPEGVHSQAAKKIAAP